MEKIDRLIAEALSEEDEALLRETEEPGWFALFFRQFHGRNAWVNQLSTIAILVYGALAIWSGWKFFSLPEAGAANWWGLIALGSVTVIGMFKLYLLNAMQTDRVLRQMRRLELVLAVKAGK